MIRKFVLALALIAMPSALLMVAGSAFADTPPTVRIVVPARDIARGEVIGESDLTFAQVPGLALPATTGSAPTSAGGRPESAVARRLRTENGLVAVANVRVVPFE